MSQCAANVRVMKTNVCDPEHCCSSDRPQEQHSPTCIQHTHTLQTCVLLFLLSTNNHKRQYRFCKMQLCKSTNRPQSENQRQPGHCDNDDDDWTVISQPGCAEPPANNRASLLSGLHLCEASGRSPSTKPSYTEPALSDVGLCLWTQIWHFLSHLSP